MFADLSRIYAGMCLILNYTIHPTNFNYNDKFQDRIY